MSGVFASPPPFSQPSFQGAEGTPLKNPLLQNNVTLLQPGAQYFRLADALQTIENLVNQVSGNLQGQIDAQGAVINSNVTAIGNVQDQTTTNTTNISTLQSEVASLQSQINTINVRLANAGIP